LFVHAWHYPHPNPERKRMGDLTSDP
jgi:hypothetical protein